MSLKGKLTIVFVISVVFAIVCIMSNMISNIGLIVLFVHLVVSAIAVYLARVQAYIVHIGEWWDDEQLLACLLVSLFPIINIMMIIEALTEDKKGSK